MNPKSIYYYLLFTLSHFVVKFKKLNFLGEYHFNALSLKEKYIRYLIDMIHFELTVFTL